MSIAAIDRRQLGALAGMAGSALFVALFTLEGWLRPGYDPRVMYVSELALGPRGWIQTLNFVILGVMFLAFARGVAAEFSGGKASRGGPALLAIIGLSFLVSGFFTMDPAATPPDQMSWHGTLHNIFGALVFSLAPASCFVFLRRFRKDPKWRHLQWWTLAAGTIALALVVVMSVGTKHVLAEPNAITEWIGVIQRAILITYLGWQFTFALGLRRATGPDREGLAQT